MILGKMFINNNRRKHRKVGIYEKRKNHTSSVEIEPYRSRRRAAIIRRENDIGLRVSARYCVLCSRVCTTTDIFDADFLTTGIEVMTDAVKFTSVKENSRISKETIRDLIGDVRPNGLQIPRRVGTV